MSLKITGNIIFFIFLNLLLSLHASPSLELSLTTLQGAPIRHQQLCIGVPYLLEIIGREIDTMPPCDMGTLQGWYCEPRGTYKTINTINGSTTKSIQSTYYVRADQEGSYTLGPIQCVTAQGVLTSNELKVTVSRSDELAKKAKSKGSTNEA